MAVLVALGPLVEVLDRRLVGTQVHAHAWELLIAMLVMESAFGLPGVAAAPIYYAYIKGELTERGLV